MFKGVADRGERAPLVKGGPERSKTGVWRQVRFCVEVGRVAFRQRLAQEEGAMLVGVSLLPTS